ncbi:Leucine-rich repeat extensin-like protein 2 [Acorus calamus]|uniref:Cell wall hydroxyproline-rich glycoprotein n=1 Tax=Acorus calamus TaxID=4465 RepID=A0AAV9EXM1_ACOCL|nr:Leucine-rich repeat extensin-like protein 2 [Acorus calamus]
MHHPRVPYYSIFLAILFLLPCPSTLAADADGGGADQTQPPSRAFLNPRIQQAYIALQAWKSAILSDPTNITGNWHGPNVCSYGGVFCSASPSDPSLTVVAGIDLNHADIAGYLPTELGLLTDLALLHLNSNRFCGSVPLTFRSLTFLHELDLSNNRFAGRFPEAVLSLPYLKYLDLRYNEFEGPIPDKLFDRPLDAIFLNHNRFRLGIPDSLGNSPASVVVLANNQLGGGLPGSAPRRLHGQPIAADPSAAAELVCPSPVEAVAADPKVVLGIGGVYLYHRRLLHQNRGTLLGT